MCKVNLNIALTKQNRKEVKWERKEGNYLWNVLIAILGSSDL